MAEKNPTQWVQADHLLNLNQKLKALADLVGQLRHELTQIEAFVFQPTKLEATQPREPLPAAPKPSATQVEDQAEPLTKAQIQEAGKVRQKLSRLPDWLPERIRSEDMRAIMRVALDINHRMQEASRPPPANPQAVAEWKEESRKLREKLGMEPAPQPQEEPKPKFKQRRMSFNQTLASLRREHGKLHVDEICAGRLGDRRTARALRDIFKGYLGTYADNVSAGMAFSHANKLVVKSPDQALASLMRAKHHVEHSDGLVSVWDTYITPGEVKASEANMLGHVGA